MNWDFGSCIDLCICHLHFLRGMNLQYFDSVITMLMLFFTFYMRIYACVAVRLLSIVVNFVLDMKRCLFRNILVLT